VKEPKIAPYGMKQLFLLDPMVSVSAFSGRRTVETGLFLVRSFSRKGRIQFADRVEATFS